MNAHNTKTLHKIFLGVVAIFWVAAGLAFAIFASIWLHFMTCFKSTCHPIVTATAYVFPVCSLLITTYAARQMLVSTSVNPEKNNRSKIIKTAVAITQQVLLGLAGIAVVFIIDYYWDEIADVFNGLTSLL